MSKSMILKRVRSRLILSLTLLLLLVLGAAESSALTVVGKARGEMPPTIAILDTALDTSLPIFEGRIVFEACVLEWSSCPNGSDYMEGKNSVVLPRSWYLSNGFSHGTQMASVAVHTNPEIKLVFVRIIGATASGFRQISTETTVERALDWVLRNHKRLGIDVVSMSQGHHRVGAPGTEYCPPSKITRNKIKELLESEIPVFFAAGNNGDRQRLDWPACIPESIAVGSADAKGIPASFSNFDPVLLDFYASGKSRIMTLNKLFINVSGTSASTVIAATHWATLKSLHPQLKYQELYQTLSATADPVATHNVIPGRLINLQSALLALTAQKNDDLDSVDFSHSAIKSEESFTPFFFGAKKKGK